MQSQIFPNTQITINRKLRSISAIKYVNTLLYYQSAFYRMLVRHFSIKEIWVVLLFKLYVLVALNHFINPNPLCNGLISPVYPIKSHFTTLP